MDEDFPWDDLIDFIDDGQVVPVIGPELLQTEVAGRQTSLYRLIAQRVAEKDKLQVAWHDFSELNDVVSAYLERPGSLPDDLHPRVARVLKELAPTFPVPTPLKKLAEIGKLNLFLSLTPDSLMARALDETRYRGAAVTRQIAFSINQSTSVQGDVQTAPNDDSPVVFNLFGRAASGAAYAIHDEDVLEYIHRLVSGDVAPPSWLMQQLRDRSMLMILGVHLPDWLGRFVLRAATKERLLTTGRRYFVARKDAPDAQTLTEFLRRFGRQTRINIFQGDAAAFVDELHRRWLERFPAQTEAASRQAEATPGIQGAEVFLSYGRENLPAVERLHEEMSKLGVKVWFDRDELKPGDRWNQAILGAIKRDVRLFIPVLSKRTAERAKTEEAYVFTEWRAAVERAGRFVDRRFIVPVVVDPEFAGINPYRNVMDAFPQFEEANLGWAPNGMPDDKLLSVLKEEIRAMRRQEGPR
jgi:TIR domain